jgi:hypothetical protein
MESQGNARLALVIDADNTQPTVIEEKILLSACYGILLKSRLMQLVGRTSGIVGGCSLQDQSRLRHAAG